jgi:hypothetical protein
MDKPSERKKDTKDCGDTDVNTTRDFGAGGKRAQLAGLWSIVPEEVVGLGPERLMTNCYRKEISGEKKEKVDLLDEILDHGPPLLNTSKPNRVL